jgi:hypothetical protein
MPIVMRPYLSQEVEEDHNTVFYRTLKVKRVSKVSPVSSSSFDKLQVGRLANMRKVFLHAALEDDRRAERSEMGTTQLLLLFLQTSLKRRYLTFQEAVFGVSALECVEHVAGAHVL